MAHASTTEDGEEAVIPTVEQFQKIFDAVDKLVDEGRMKARTNDIAVIVTMRAGENVRVEVRTRVKLLELWKDLPQAAHLQKAPPVNQVPLFFLLADTAESISLVYELDKKAVILN